MYKFLRCFKALRKGDIGFRKVSDLVFTFTLGKVVDVEINSVDSLDYDYHYWSAINT